MKYVSLGNDTIKITGMGVTYDIPTDRINTSAQCLDWIHQLHVKSWMTPEIEWEFISTLFQVIPNDLWSGAGFNHDKDSIIRGDNKKMRRFIIEMMNKED
jgi:hypothetical protein